MRLTAKITSRLVRLAYPRWYRRRYSAALEETLATELDRAWRRGYLALARTMISTLGDLTLSAVRVRRLPVAGRGRDRREMSTTMFSGLTIDIRYGVKALSRRPAFFAFAVLILGLGIGASALVFSLVERVMLRPLPFDEAHRLVRVATTIDAMGWNRIGVAGPLYMDVRDQLEGLERVGGYTLGEVNLAADERPERALRAEITHELLEVLGVTPAIGRDFGAEDELPGAPRQALVSYGLAARALGGADALGRTLRIDGVPHRIVGVMPAGFAFPRREVSVWTNHELDPAIYANEQLRGNHYLTVVGRAVDGWEATASGRVAELNRWLHESVELYRPAFGFHVEVVPLVEEIVGPTRPTLLALIGAVGLVLLIATANVANLLLFRSEGRRREFAVRTAVGASGLGIARQILVESALVTSAACALGLGLASLGLVVLDVPMRSVLPDLAEPTMGIAVVGAASLSALICGLMFSALPALRCARDSAVETLRARSAGAAGRAWVGRGLVVVEVTLSVTLLVSAGLLVRSLDQLLGVDPGFDATSVATAEVELPAISHPTFSEVQGFYDRLLQQARALPGVAAVGITDTLPFRDPVRQTAVWVEGFVESEDSVLPSTDLQIVTPGYFEATRLRLVEGRFLNDSDTADGAPAVVVNTRFVEDNWPGESGLGKQIQLFSRQHARIVGVVEPVIAEDLGAAPRAQTYAPFHQVAVYANPQGRPISNLTVVARSEVDSSQVAGQITEIVRVLDPTLPVHNVQTLATVVDSATTRPRLLATVLAAFAILAFGLGIVGVYGVLSYAVAQRGHEFGVRIALGATRGGIMRLVVGEGAALAAVGLVLGAAGAWATGRALSSLLFGVSAFDPITIVVTTVTVLTAAVSASALPARRATRIDPVTALRSD